MTDAPERVWLDWPAANKGDPVYDEPPERDTQPGQTEYRRADLPPTLAAALTLPEVAKLIEAVEKLGLRKLVAGWNGEDRDTPYTPHPSHLWAKINTTCGVVYEIDAALAALARLKGDTP